MEQSLPAVPARRPESTRRVGETIEGQRRILIGSIDERRSYDRVCCRVVQKIIGAPLGGRASNTLQIGFHIRLPFSFYP